MGVLVIEMGEGALMLYVRVCLPGTCVHLSLHQAIYHNKDGSHDEARSYGMAALILNIAAVLYTVVVVVVIILSVSISASSNN